MGALEKKRLSGLKAIPLLSLFALPSSFEAVPPPVPSAGVVERDLEEQYEAIPVQPDRPFPDIEIDIPDDQLKLPAYMKVQVDQFELEGNESFSNYEIQKWIQEDCGKEYCMQDLVDLCKKIEAAYAKRGYFLARVYPPPQKIRDNTVLLRVMEGKLGNIEIEGNRYYPTSLIEKYFEKVKGKPVRYQNLMRVLFLLNEVANLKAAMVLKKGERVGTADAIVRIEDGRPSHLYLNANNYGKDLTTKYRYGGRYDWGSMLIYGDKFSVAQVFGMPLTQLTFTDLVYTIPVTRNGTFLEFAYLYSYFKINDVEPLLIRGQSKIGTVKWTHAFTRARDYSIDTYAVFDLKNIKNFFFNTTASFDQLRILWPGAKFDLTDRWGARNVLDLRMGIGIPGIFGAMAAHDAPLASRVGAGSQFVQFNGEYDRIQRIRKDSFLYLKGTAQYSPSLLTLPQQFYIGGADTVRGFPLAVGLGDSGYTVSAEIRIPPLFLSNTKYVLQRGKTWREAVQLVGFVDHGGVFLHRENDLFLTGAGVGIRVKGLYFLELSFDVGFPLDHRDLSNGAFGYLKVTSNPF
jgi:hemolysin activation/secretion protein